MNNYIGIIILSIVAIVVAWMIVYPFVRFSIFLLDKVLGVKRTLKFLLIFLSIILGVGIIFMILNFYENQNQCEFAMIPYSPPFFGCRAIPQEDHNCHNGGGVFGLCSGLDKPLILLYPENEMNVSVKLRYTPGFSATFPAYGEQISGWSVVAHPDGTLHDMSSNQDTYGLFWEGNSSDMHFDMSRGFVVPGSEIREFLYEKLTELGLNTKERSDFIMYWYPKLQKYPYVQITFAGKDYTDRAELEIIPHPESLLRVFMVAKPLVENKIIPPQNIQPFERKGFSVVEWGGTIIE